MSRSVIKADIMILKPSELKIGDYILWGSCRCRVMSILKGNPDKYMMILILPYEDNYIWIPKYKNYYKINKCEEINHDGTKPWNKFEGEKCKCYNCEGKYRNGFRTYNEKEGRYICEACEGVVRG